MQETLVKTHLIITDIHEEYFVDWCGSIMNTQPVIENGKPIFIISNIGLFLFSKIMTPIGNNIASKYFIIINNSFNLIPNNTSTKFNAIPSASNTSITT